MKIVFHLIVCEIQTFYCGEKVSISIQRFFIPNYLTFKKRRELNKQWIEF